MSNKNLANAIRFLAIDAVEKANSGHPGMPMGMADFASVLFNEFLNFNPKDPKWHNRDRFILSAGHGSMLLYSLLYLTGYEDIKIEDIKNFRQLHSKCAGHPEYGELKAIETTTGPLGQGIANAVGMAISEKLLKARFGNKIFDHKIYALVGDGCLMEGISQEALSIAGHLNLNNLIVIWDNNSISIDGKTSIATSENMHLRFQALGFDIIAIDGHNFDEIRHSLITAKNSTKPILIDCKTTIGFGSPSRAGSQKAHGSPLGADEILKTRKNLQWEHAPFEIPNDIKEAWLKASNRCLNNYQQSLNNLKTLDNNQQNLFDLIINKKFPQDLSNYFKNLYSDINHQQANQATRKSSHEILEKLTNFLPNLLGGSADLTESVLTKTSTTHAVTANDFSGRYLHYGVREHAMASIMNGIALHGNFIPYGGTFLVFSDYLKPALRLSALMQLQVLYVLTHDSIGLGEDGPTHQPIEHLAMLRSIPNLNNFRPADSEETLASFEIALHHQKTPSALILSRQNLPFISKATKNFNKGAYTIIDHPNPQVILIASGSELQIAVNSQKILAEKNINCRVISALCLEIFYQQPQSYQDEILANHNRNNIIYIAIEASINQGWHRLIGTDGHFIGMQHFGASAPAKDLYNYFNINEQQVINIVNNNIKNK